MTYKEFGDWCNYRAADGAWGLLQAMMAINIINEMQKIPFWKRKKKWAEVGPDVMKDIVEPVNAVIKSSLE